MTDPVVNENTQNYSKKKRCLHGVHKHTIRLIEVCYVCVFVRASDDLKRNMVPADTMEQFQKELDQGKVSNNKPHAAQNV